MTVSPIETDVSFPSLYKKTKTGAIQRWDIKVGSSYFAQGSWVIVTKFGQVDGAIQETSDLISEGKNIGRSNETTPYQQAVSEAKSRWEKQIKDGYVETLAKAEAGEEERSGVRPMLAHSFEKHASKVKYPCYVQPKLDGIRCIAIIEDGMCSLHSRNLEPITGVPHIVAELENLFQKGKIVLDGELYNPHIPFEVITSVVRKQKSLHQDHTLVQYHVYDTAYEGNFQERFVKSNFMSRKLGQELNHIRRVQTLVAHSEQDVFSIFKEQRKQGFEGSMVRNVEGKYVGTRSYDLLKVKQFEDGEFEIVGVKKGRGKLAEMGIFICRTEEGKEFDVKCMGSLESLKAYLSNPNDYIGKKLTVKFQNLTEDGLPRFPIGVTVRDYE